MATGSEETRVPISIPVDDSAAGKAAQSIDQLREAVQKSKDALKDYAAQMRDIRGNSDEMKAARDELRKKLEAEKVAISDGALALAKQGVSYDRLATAAKRTAKEQEKAAKDAAKEAKASEKEQEKAAKDAMKEKSDALKSAIGSAGGPVSAISSKLNGLTDVLGGTSGGMAAVAGAAALVAAGLYAVGKAAVSAAYDIGKWIVVAADAERLSQLTRQANLGGNETSAKNLGDQVDAIARKVPLARDQIDWIGREEVYALHHHIGGDHPILSWTGRQHRGVIQQTESFRRAIGQGAHQPRDQVELIDRLARGISFSHRPAAADRGLWRPARH